MSHDPEFDGPLATLPLLVPRHAWAGDDQVHLVSAELGAVQIRELVERADGLEGVGPLFGARGERPHLDLPLPDARFYTYERSRDNAPDASFGLRASPPIRTDSPPRVAAARARKSLDPWLAALEDEEALRAQVPHPIVFATLEELREDASIDLRVRRSGVTIRSVGTATPAVRLSQGRLLRLLCYLLDDDQVMRLADELLDRDPLEALLLFECGFPVLGLDASAERKAPTPTPEQATRLLQHEDRDVRQRAIAVLEGMHRPGASIRSQSR